MYFAGIVPWLTAQAQSELTTGEQRRCLGRPVPEPDGRSRGHCSPLSALAGLLKPCLGYAVKESPQATATILQAFRASCRSLQLALPGTAFHLSEFGLVLVLLAFKTFYRLLHCAPAGRVLPLEA